MPTLSKILKSSLKVLSIIFLQACDDNYSIQKVEPDLQAVSDLSPINGDEFLGSNGEISPNQKTTLSGSCAPNGGTVTIRSEEMEPTEISCPCENDTYACGEVFFSGTGVNGLAPKVDMTITDLNGNQKKVDMKVRIVRPIVTASPISEIIETSKSYPITGMCTPPRATVAVSNDSMIPKTTECVCQDDRTFACGPVKFDGSQAKPQLRVDIRDPIGNSAPPSAIEVEVNTRISLDPVGNVTINTPTTFTGTCAPEGKDIKISAGGAQPPTKECGACPQNGSFSCTETYTALPPNAEFVASIGGVSSATNASPLPVVAIGGNSGSHTLTVDLKVGDGAEISGTCAPEGETVVLDFIGALPATDNCGVCSNGTYTCNGPYSQVYSSVQVTAKLGTVTSQLVINSSDSVKLTAPVSPSVGTPVSLSGICGPEGQTVNVSVANATPSSTNCGTCAAGVFSCSQTYTVLPQSIIFETTAGTATHNTTVSGGVTLDLITIPASSEGDNVSISGSCGPDGAGNITIDGSDDGLVPASLTCSCSSGSVSCPPATFDGSVTSPSLSGTLTFGGETASDNVSTSITPLAVTPNFSATNLIEGDSVTIAGSCNKNGTNNITVAGADDGMVPSSLTCNCNAGTISCPSGVTFDGSVTSPSVGVSIANGTRTELANQPMNVTALDVSLNLPASRYALQPITLTGSCNKNGSNNVTIDGTSLGMSPTIQTCNCSSGAVSCGSTVTFDGSVTNPTVPISLNNGSQSANADDSLAISNNAELALDLSAPMTIHEGDNLIFTIALNNNGAAASNVALTNSCPAGTTFQAGATTATTGSYSAPNWTIGSIAHAGSATLSLACRVNSATGGGSLTQNIVAGNITLDQTDDNLSNNADSVTVAINNTADLQIQIKAGPRLVASTKDVSYVISVLNKGPALAESVSITEQCPVGSTYKPAETTTTIGSYNDSTGEWTVGSIPAGDTEELKIVCTTSVSQDGLQVVSEIIASDVSMEQTDSNPKNSLPTETIEVNAIQAMFGCRASYYNEDGMNGICGKTNSGDVDCWSHKAEFNGDGTRGSAVSMSGWSGDVNISSPLEANGFILTTDGKLWSFGIYSSSVTASRALGHENPVTGFNNVEEIQGGWSSERRPICIAGDHTEACVILDNNELWCWGGNVYGELGNGTKTYSHAPVKGADGAIHVLAAGSVTCYVDAAEEVYCTGQGNNGQMGDGANSDNTTYNKVSGLTDVHSLTATGFKDTKTVCALKNDGTVWCWGQDTYGLLGNGNPIANSNVPVQVSGLTSITKIQATNENFCALKSDGTVWCWGRGNTGKNGDGATSDNSIPAQVTLPDTVKELDSGIDHVCTLLNNNKIYCWGKGGYDKFGIGNNNNQLLPIQWGGSSEPAADYVVSFAFDICRVTNLEAYCLGRASGATKTSPLLDHNL